jgi:hypothetical protein
MAQWDAIRTLDLQRRGPDLKPPYLKIHSGILNGSSEIGWAKWDVGEFCYSEPHGRCRVWLQVQAETSEGLTPPMEWRRLGPHKHDRGKQDRQRKEE